MSTARRLLTKDDVLSRLRRAVEAAGSQANFGREHQINPSRVGDTINRNVRPYGRILAALGIEKVTLYREVQAAEERHGD